MTSPTVVVFPDAELVAVTILRSALDDATTVGTEWPDDLLQKVQGGVVSVTRGGGAVVQRYVLEDVTLDIDVLAADKGQAHDLAQLVRAHLQAARGTTVDGAQIYRVADVSLIWLPYEPDAETAPVPRYVLVMQMRLRGRPAIT
ncbi:head-to-tail connector complex protein [Streptomyces phage Kromp]|uniref:Head-to-tail connector complex protein n=1 Tax=Streptomyces phage Kromp TaxID=2315619 RepID=A0A386KBB4_9CAUD|nr:head-to-tail connector complex protein [Streptomyces phage Kromp]